MIATRRSLPVILVGGTWLSALTEKNILFDEYSNYAAKTEYGIYPSKVSRRCKPTKGWRMIK